jgi:hypothetical protein
MGLGLRLNGISQTEEMATQIAKHLDLKDVPKDLLFWNGNDAPEDYGQRDCGWENVIAAAKPNLVVVDSLAGVFGKLESSNPDANESFQTLWAVMQEERCSIIGIHHTRKRKDEGQIDYLENYSNLQEWFDNTRGPRVLINNSDVRLGVTRPSPKTNVKQTALVFGGFRRVAGAIPLLRVAREFDSDGDPLGYYPVTGRDLLNPEDTPILDALQPSFRYKDAERLLDGDPTKTTKFLNRVVAAGVVLRPPARKQPYTKIELDEASSLRLAA